MENNNLSERKRRSKERHKKKRQRQVTGIACIAIAIVLVFSVRALVDIADKQNVPVVNIDSSVEKYSSEDSDNSDNSVTYSDYDNDLPEKVEGIAALWYYDEFLVSRYEAFRILNPDLTDEEICWMVGCDLDLGPYEQTSEVPDPNDILLLVNKHFYLPAGYEPSDLISVGNTKMRKEAGEAMQEMIGDAAKEGLNLWSQSGYRGYGLQERLFNDYSASDGIKAAETYSARPGYSEHQTGLTTDLNTITHAFGDTAEGKWVAENCWMYGYIIRYTAENSPVTLYMPEPWHMRYIGKDAAKRMHDENIQSFEEYWVKYVKL